MTSEVYLKVSQINSGLYDFNILQTLGETTLQHFYIS